jgi:hypothetical protein
MKILIGAALAALISTAASAAIGPPPPFTEADKAQSKEDMAIITKPVHLVPDSNPAARDARLASCIEYWEANLSRDRHPKSRQFLMGIRVARCMFRTNYTIINGPCHPFSVATDRGWPAAIRLASQSKCYAKFDRVLPARMPTR